jgi:hypothetical protein
MRIYEKCIAENTTGINVGIFIVVKRLKIAFISITTMIHSMIIKKIKK